MSFNSSVQSLFTGMAGSIAGIIVYSDAENKLYNYATLGYISAAIIMLCIYLATRLKVK